MIQVYGLQLELTEERKRRIGAALKDTRRQLARELSYSVDLVNWQRVAFYRQHITKLEGMLHDG